MFEEATWTAKEMLPSLPSDDCLPEKLADRSRMNGRMTVAKSLGKYLSNRNKQWAGNFSVRQVGFDSNGSTKRWQIVRKRT